jgi:hypothetical protein
MLPRQSRVDIWEGASLQPLVVLQTEYQRLSRSVGIVCLRTKGKEFVCSPHLTYKSQDFHLILRFHFFSLTFRSYHKNKQTNSVALGPQENYSDWSTATGRRILVPTFMDRGMSRGQGGGTPTVVNLSFLDRSRYFFYTVAPHLCPRGWLDPVPDPLLLWKCGRAQNRTRYLCVCSQELWPQDQGGVPSVPTTF